jgi:hypothetical protein
MIFLSSSNKPRLVFPPLQFIVDSHAVIAFEDEKKNSVAVVRKRTIPTERPPLVGEVSANFCV